MGTKRINDQSERQLSPPLNFLSNFASSHVMHVSSFAGQVQKIQTELGMGLISPFGGCSDGAGSTGTGQAWQGQQGQFRTKRSCLVIVTQFRAKHSFLVIVPLSFPRRLTLLGLMQSPAKAFPPGVELPEGFV